MLKERIKQLADSHYKFQILFDNFIARLQVGEFLYFEKSCHFTNSAPRVQRYLKQALVKDGVANDYLIETIRDPESKANQKVVKLIKIK